MSKLNLSRLNPRQMEAVLHGEGPLLILAGAGSGKTSTMTARIAHLIVERGIAANAILGLSFTNKAAGELKERVHGLVSGVGGAQAAQGLTITTFHSLCARILRVHATKLGFQTGFTIVDENDQKDILKEVFRNVKIDDRKFDLGTILFEIGQAKGKLLKPEEAEAYFLESPRLSTAYQIAAATSFTKYQESLRALNAMDFDDLLYYGVALLERHADVRAQYNQRFRHILVDEYQDTNPTQFRILELMTEKQRNLCVVGDDDQSIYSWRGADSSHILEFSRRFPEAQTITLDQNYRSTTTILEAANGVISRNPKRHPKKLWSNRGRGSLISEVVVEDDRGEAEFVAREVGEKARGRNLAWKQFAVLYRSNAQSRTFEEAFRRHRIPYKVVGGMSFLDRREVKDVLSYLRVVVNPRDDASLRRILNWPARGVGKSTIEALGSHAFEAEIPVFEAMKSEPVLTELNAKSARAVAGFRELILTLRAELEATPVEPESLVAWSRTLLFRAGVKAALEEENKDDPAQFARQWENVEEVLHSLGQVIAEFPRETESKNPVLAVQEFLNRMTLEAQDEKDESSQDEEVELDRVTFLTLHGAKGLEYPVVFLVGMEEGLLPHRRTIEEATDFSEERRLCYVGITRARDELFLVRARNRIRYGKPVPRTASRFLKEIPSELLTQIDHSHGPDATDSVEAREKHEALVKNHLAGIRAMLEKT